LTIQPKIKPLQSSSYAVSETGFLWKKTSDTIKSLFKTNIFKFNLVTFFFVVDQKSFRDALSILNYNYDVLWHNLHMAGLLKAK